MTSINNDKAISAGILITAEPNPVVEDVESVTIVTPQNEAQARPLAGAEHRTTLPADEAMVSKHQAFVVTLRAEHGSIPPVIRLRQFLKTALRSFGLRCVEVQEVAGVEHEQIADANGYSIGPKPAEQAIREQDFTRPERVNSSAIPSQTGTLTTRKPGKSSKQSGHAPTSGGSRSRILRHAHDIGGPFTHRPSVSEPAEPEIRACPLLNSEFAIPEEIHAT